MTTKAQRHSRLLELADLIERVGETQFNYSQWAARYKTAQHGPRATVLRAGMTVRDVIDIGLREGDCSTVGCVAGLAVTLGLEAEYYPNGWRDMPIPQYAGQCLGLNAKERDLVFLGGAMVEAGLAEYNADKVHPLNHVRNTVTPVEVAKMLRMVAEGEVKL